MIPKKIGETGWTVQDWDSQWPPVFSNGQSTCNIEVDRDGNVCIEHETRDYGTFRGYQDVRTYIPLEVLAEVLRLNGYDVTRNERIPWDPDHDQVSPCKCGHTYERHFDTYEEMDPVGCKYCDCAVWQPRE